MLIREIVIIDRNRKMMRIFLFSFFQCQCDGK